MKKISKWLLFLTTMVVAAVSVFGLAACGNDDGGVKTSDYAGTYKFVKFTEEGKTYSVGDKYQYYDASFNKKEITLTADYFVMVFGEDGTFTVSSPLEEHNQVTSPSCNQIYGNMTGIWQTDSTWGVKVTIDGADIRLLDSDGQEMTYEFIVGLKSYKYYFQKVNA